MQMNLDRTRWYTKQELSDLYGISLSTTKRSLDAIGADKSNRTFSGQTLDDFDYARYLFQKGWSKKKVQQFFSSRNQIKTIPNQ